MLILLRHSLRVANLVFVRMHELGKDGGCFVKAPLVTHEVDMIAAS